MLVLNSIKIFTGTVLVALFSFIEECSQYFIPGRSFDLFDILSDAFGILIFTWFTYIFDDKYNNQ